MANDGTNKKSGEVRLVKVNSKEKTTKRYDAYGYEIPEEAHRDDARYADERGYAADGSERENGGSGITAPGHRYNADIRAAIESGAHLKPRQNNNVERGYRGGSEEEERYAYTSKDAGRSSGAAAGRTGNTGNTGRSERAESTGRIDRAERREKNASGASAGRNRYSHVKNRSIYDEELLADERGRSGGAGSERAYPKNGSGVDDTRNRSDARTGGRAGADGSEEKRKKQTDKGGKRRRTSDGKEKKRAEEARREAEREQERKEEEKKPLTAHEKRRNIAKARRRETVGNVFKVIAVVLVVALIIALITFNSKKGGGINTQFVSAGYIEDAAYGKLSFLRAETPVYSAFSGVFMPSVNEGDRVGKNTVIGHVVKAEYSDALSELKEVESKINAALKASEYVEAGKTGEMLALENAIDGEFDYLSGLAMSGTLSGYSQSFSRLDELFSQKNELEMSADNADTYISGLRRERSSILNKIESSMHEVRTNISGVISFRCDGNEGRVSEAAQTLEDRIASTNFTSMQSSTLTAGELAAVTLPEGELSVSSGTSVSNGSIVARIAPENGYYVTIPVEPEQHHITGGAKAEIYVTGGNIRFEAETVGVYYTAEGAIAVFKTARALEGTVSLRSEEGRIVFSHVEGLKVPLRVLSEWDTAGVTARITLLRSGYIRYAYVNVLGRDNDYAIINSRSFLDDGSGVSVRENDEYVVNYENFYEGQGI